MAVSTLKQGVVDLKELILNSFYFWIDFEQFLLLEGVVVMKLDFLTSWSQLFLLESCIGFVLYIGTGAFRHILGFFTLLVCT